MRAFYLFLHRVNSRCDKCPRSLSPLFLQSTRGGDSTSQHPSDAPGKERSESSAMSREAHMDASPTSHPSPGNEVAIFLSYILCTSLSIPVCSLSLLLDFPQLSCRGLLMRGYQMSNMDFVSLFLFLRIVSISDLAPTELSQILNVQSIPTRTDFRESTLPNKKH